MVLKKRLVLPWVFAAALVLSSCRGGAEANPAPAASSTTLLSASPNAADSEFLPNAAEGFEVRLWAEAENARSLAVSPDGRFVFVGTRAGVIHKITVVDGEASKVEVFQKDLNGSNGVCFVGEDLYVGELLRVVKYPAAKGFEPLSTGEVVLEDLPNERHHGWRYIKAGPDGRVYIGIGAPCNVCERPDDERFASICSFLPDGSDFKVEAKGVRNSVGFDWKTGTQDLYFTDNGRDMLGDDIPPCELNLLPNQKTGLHYGFPYFWGDNQPDPEFGKKAPKGDYQIPVAKFQAHVAPLGCHFPRHAQWSTLLKDKVLVAQHGSWNRSTPVGYRVVTVDLASKDKAEITPLLDGFLGVAEKRYPVYGRPVDIAELDNGTLLISDDSRGRLWAVTPKS